MLKKILDIYCIPGKFIIYLISRTGNNSFDARKERFIKKHTLSREDAEKLFIKDEHDCYVIMAMLPWMVFIGIIVELIKLVI